VEAAKALFNLMVKLEQLQPQKSVRLEVSAPDVASLLAEWLNRLISEKDINNLYFCDFKIDKIEKTGDSFWLLGEARGQEIDPENFSVETEVKAVTYAGLKCGEKEGKFYCQCVVDV
jgi:SHS2 domain-containing protein